MSLQDGVFMLWLHSTPYELVEIILTAVIQKA